MSTRKQEKKYVLAFDHGTSGVKTALCSVYGDTIDFVFKKTPLYLIGEGGAEQNPNEWWEAVLKTSKRLTDRNETLIDDIVAISCSSQWSGTVPVDQDGNHLMNAIIWMDSRGAPYLRKTLSGFPKVSGYPLKDIIQFIYKTGGAPGLSGKDPISHILYLKYELPEVYEETYKFLECVDYLNLKFTGKFAASTDSITLHWVTNTRDINNIKYDKSLIKRLKIDKEKLPDLKGPTVILGNVLPRVADELGINRDVKVSMGAPDLLSAIIGSGSVEDYQGHIYIGTSSWIICHVPFKKTDISHNMAAIPAAIPGKYFVVNEQESAGACLNFLRDNIFYTEDEKYFGNVEVYKIFDKIAENVPVGSNQVIFTPWLYGERTPIEDHTVRGGLFNLSLNTKKEHLIRAVFEGVAYNSRWVLKYVEAFIKRKLDPLNIIGGGAQSDVWCQIYADVLNRTIRRVKDPIQANARGVAFIASVSLGYITFNDIPGLIEYSATFHPNPKNVKTYDRLFKEFLTIYKNNRKMYKRLN
ncbi:MAG: FGGY-family carbohydrate kinase [Candidatus Heimdallarchaeota archaeon]|nr:MAG: FGGY-family carbohydrate kinase [Candidatus Heimdallarchaeota archaeon]